MSTTFKERKDEIRLAFIAAVQEYKTAKKSGDEKVYGSKLELACSLRDMFSALVKESGKYGTILVKMNSNLTNIDSGTNPKKEKPAVASKKPVADKAKPIKKKPTIKKVEITSEDL